MAAQLLIDAEIVAQGMQAPYPGDGFAISVFRYRVREVVEGAYSHPVLLAGHVLADVNWPEFAIGARHRLRLTPAFPEHSTLLNLFAEEARLIGVFFCISFEVLT